MGMDLITLNLKLAFREPGCPVCRIRQRAERRYLLNLLHENVNDGTTRLHLVRGLGFCPRHAWDLQATEQRHWSDGMGTGIIYEDLVGRILNTSSSYLAQGPSAWRSAPARLVSYFFNLDRLRAWLERRGRPGRRLAQALPPPSPARLLRARLSPTGPCRVCELVDWSEETHLTWLAQLSSDPEFRGWYAASDGLCLPHFRQALAYTENEEAVRFLVKVTADKLTPLLADLQEYGRKHSWENRNEPKYPWEQASWIRAVAFFSGEAPGWESADIYQVRQQAMANYRTRADMPVIREAAGATKG